MDHAVAASQYSVALFQITMKHLLCPIGGLALLYAIVASPQHLVEQEAPLTRQVRGSGGDKIIFKKLSIVDKVEVSNSGTALTMEFRTSKGNSTLRIDATGQVKLAETQLQPAEVTPAKAGLMKSCQG